MNLRKRIEKLELLQKQTTCEHTFMEITIERTSATTIKIKATCFSCGKECLRSGPGKELLSAERLLRDCLLKDEENNE